MSTHSGRATPWSVPGCRIPANPVGSAERTCSASPAPGGGTGVDDYSRLVPYCEFFFDEALPRIERVLKVAILRRGLPHAIYVDHGQVYSATQFGAACATLGIQRIHTAPYAPQAKGKQERFFATLRAQFLPEVQASGITTLDMPTPALRAGASVARLADS